MSRSKLPSIAALIGGAAVLAGCVSLFPKQPPAQFYRFDVQPGPAPEGASTGPTFDVAHVSTLFDQASAGDRILTSVGDQAAYIAQSRWISPAVVLFDEAEVKAFDAAGGPARLLPRGGSASASLQLDVETFEAVYPGNMEAAPTVVVRVRGRLVRLGDRQILGDKIFESRKLAGDNRVSAIVEAFDAATTDALGQVVTWTGTTGQGR